MTQTIKDRKGVCGIPTSTMDVKAHELGGCGVNHSFTGVQSTGNLDHAKIHQNCPINVVRTTKSVNV